LRFSAAPFFVEKFVGNKKDAAWKLAAGWVK
jgi:hypothetical protein